MTVWDKWQFELDRITGGLGYGITFDLNLPSQTDVEKVQADTQKVRIDSLTQLFEHGGQSGICRGRARPPEAYKRLDLHQQAPTLTIPIAAKRYARNIKPQETATETRILPATRTYVNRVIRMARRSQNGLRDDLEDIGDQWINDVEDELMKNLAAYARRTGYELEQVITVWAEVHPESSIAVQVEDTPQMIGGNSTSGLNSPTPCVKPTWNTCVASPSPPARPSQTTS